MPFRCIVPFCGSTSTKEPKLKFFGFPKSELSRTRWFDAIERGTGVKLKEARSSLVSSILNRVCEHHFKPDDFINFHGTNIQKNNVFPSRFIRSVKPNVSQKFTTLAEKILERRNLPLPMKPATVEKEIPTEDIVKLKCRMCVERRGNNFISGYLPKFNSKVRILQALRDTFAMDIVNSRNYPKKICTPCLNKLQSAYEFKHQILNSDAKILELAKELNSAKEDPPVTILSTSDENAVFIIKELPMQEFKQEPEMTIEGDQEAFAETLSDDEIKMEPEEIIEPSFLIENIGAVSEQNEDGMSHGIKETSEDVHEEILQGTSEVTESSSVSHNRKGSVDGLQQALKNEQKHKRKSESQHEEFPEENRKKRKISEKDSEDDEDLCFIDESSSSDESSLKLKFHTPLDLESMLKEAEEKKKKEKEKPYERWPGQKAETVRQMKQRKKEERQARRGLNQSDEPPPSSSKKGPKTLPIDVDRMLKIALKKEQISNEKTYEEWPKEVKEKKPRNEKKGRYICKKCNKEEKFYLDLMKHVDFSEEGCIELYKTNSTCYLCDRKFIFKSSKYEHLNKEHKDDVPQNGKCPHCKRLSCHYKKPIFYERHYRSHVAEPKIICPDCGKKFYSSKLYSGHAFLHLEAKKNSTKDSKFYCDHCEYVGKSKMLLGTHMRKHFDFAKAVCELCSKVVANSQSLQIHKFRIHKIAEHGCYYCKTCDFCFFGNHEFVKHIKMCNGPLGKKHPPLCVRVPRKDLADDIVIIKVHQ